MGLIYSRIRICAPAGIRIGDCDTAKVHAADDVRSLLLGHVRIEQRVVFRRIAVRPAIDGDGGDVASRIEAARAEHAAELIADVALEGLERASPSSSARADVF